MTQLHEDHWEYRLSEVLDNLMHIIRNHSWTESGDTDQDACNAKAVQLTACQLIIDTYIKTMHMRHAKESVAIERADKQEQETIRVMTVSEYLAKHGYIYENKSGEQKTEPEEGQ